MAIKRTVAIDAAYYYPTHQYGGSHNQIAETDDYVFVTYRKGDRTTGYIYIMRWNKNTHAFDQGPTQIGSSNDGHDFHALTITSSGMLRFVTGGYETALTIRLATTAYDSTAWGTATRIDGGTTRTGMEGTYRLDSSGNNHLFCSHYGNSWNNPPQLYYGYATNAAPTSWTWTQLTTGYGTGASARGSLNGDMDIFESGGTTTVGVCWANYPITGTYATNYKNLYYLQSTTGFSTATKASGSAVTLPVSVSSSGVCAAADLVDDGYHYGYWQKLAFDNAGIPHILSDGDRTVNGDYTEVYSFRDGAWESHDLPYLSNDDNTTNHHNWGQALMERDGTLYAYASVFGETGYSILRWESTDGFDTYTQVTLMPEGTPYTTEGPLGDGGELPGYDYANGYWGGFCYPKVAVGNPDLVVFGITDDVYSSVVLLWLYEIEATADSDSILLDWSGAV